MRPLLPCEQSTSQLLQQGRHVLLHLSWVSQGTGQDHPPDSSLHFSGRDNLGHVKEIFNHTINLSRIA